MAKVISTLAYQITMDYSKFQEGAIATRKELSAARRVIEETRTPVEKLQVATEGLGKMLASGAIDADTHARALKKLQSEFASVDGEVSNAVPGLQKLQDILTPANLAATAGATAFGLLAGGLHAAYERAKEIDELGDKAVKLGIDPESLSLLTIAGDFADVSAERVEAGIQKMLVSVGKAAGGNKKLGETFSALGLDAKKLIAESPDQIFEDIAEALRKIPSNAQELALISELFGKGNLELRAMLDNFDEFKQKAIATDAVITQSVVDKIAEADEASKQLSHSWDGLITQLTTALAPEAAKVFEQMSKDLKSLTEDAQYIKTFGLFPEAGQDPFLEHQRRLLHQQKKLSFDEIKFMEDQQKQREKMGFITDHDPLDVMLFKGTKEQANKRAIEKIGGEDDDEDAPARSVEKEVKAKQKLLEHLKLEADLLGKTKAEAAAIRTERLGASAAEIEIARALGAQEDMFDQQKKAAEELTRATKETERHAAQVEKALQVKATKALDDLLTKPQKVAKELAAIRDQLTDSQFEAVLNAEAKALMGKASDPQFAGAALRGSQEDIASRARQTADQSRSDSKNIEAIKEGILKLVKQAEKGPIEINSVSVGGL